MLLPEPLTPVPQVRAPSGIVASTSCKLCSVATRIRIAPGLLARRPGDPIGALSRYEWDNRDPDGHGKRLWNAATSQIAAIDAASITVLFHGNVTDIDGKPGLAEAVYFRSPAGATVALARHGPPHATAAGAAITGDVRVLRCLQPHQADDVAASSRHKDKNQ